MSELLTQLKQRRKALGLKQDDMMLRIGMSRQQYQHLESKGNPRLDTLELIVTGLNCELMLIPKEKLAGVKAVLSGSIDESGEADDENAATADDPWKDILGEDE